MGQGCITFELLMYIFDVAKLKNTGLAWECCIFFNNLIVEHRFVKKVKELRGSGAEQIEK